MPPKAAPTILAAKPGTRARPDISPITLVPNTAGTSSAKAKEPERPKNPPSPSPEPKPPPRRPSPPAPALHSSAMASNDRDKFDVDLENTPGTLSGGWREISGWLTQITLKETLNSDLRDSGRKAAYAASLLSGGAIAWMSSLLQQNPTILGFRYLLCLCSRRDV